MAQGGDLQHVDSPEELETLLEDALLLHEGAAVAALFEDRDVLVSGAGCVISRSRFPTFRFPSNRVRRGCCGPAAFRTTTTVTGADNLHQKCRITAPPPTRPAIQPVERRPSAPCLRLSHYSRGQDHDRAAALLETVDLPDRALPSKDDVH
jgi:hypothetical protein